MAKEQPYQAYLLRCWRDGLEEAESRWRFSVEVVYGAGDRTRRGFGNLDNLMAYLRQQLAAPPPGTAEEAD